MAAKEQLNENQKSFHYYSNCHRVASRLINQIQERTIIPDNWWIFHTFRIDSTKFQILCHKILCLILPRPPVLEIRQNKSSAKKYFREYWTMAPASTGTFEPLRHRSGTMRERLHAYTKRTLGAGGSYNDAVRCFSFSSLWLKQNFRNEWAKRFHCLNCSVFHQWF